MSEQEPKEYQPKHKTQISLDQYHGVGQGAMRINNPIADGFMKTADIRGDIVIIKKPEDRTRNYEEIGTVRVAKLLRLPRITAWRGRGITQTQKIDNTWYIAIDDQKLSDKAARTNDGGKKFIDLYADAFGQEVTKGIKTVLRQEKLLNSGDYNLTFFTNYWQVFTEELLLLPIAGLDTLLHSSDPAQFALGIAKVAALYATVNTAFNVINLLGVGTRTLIERFPKTKDTKVFGMELPRYEEPFIGHSVPELLMPLVPVDRLARGLIYLNKNGNDLIKQVDSQS